MLVKTQIKKQWFFKNEKFDADNFIGKIQFDPVWRITSSNSNEEIVKAALNRNPLSFIEETFPLIESSAHLVECNVVKAIGNFNQNSNGFGLFLEGEINGFSRLTSLEIIDYGINENIEKDVVEDFDDIRLTDYVNDSIFNFELAQINRFSSEFSLVGSFAGNHYDYDIALQNKIYVKAVAWGIMQKNSMPVWIEYLVDAAMNFKEGDLKMAALNYYSAYENFVTIIHDQMAFEYFARKSTKTEHDLTDLRKFAQNRKRLAGKAADIARHLDLFVDNLKPTINKLDGLSDIRNSVAHGSAQTITNDEVIDIAYHILIFIHTIGSQTNIKEKDWKAVIKCTR